MITKGLEIQGIAWRGEWRSGYENQDQDYVKLESENNITV